MTENFFNLDDLSQGIARNLAKGVSTRIFPGDQAMLSVGSTRAWQLQRRTFSPAGTVGRDSRRQRRPSTGW